MLRVDLLNTDDQPLVETGEVLIVSITDLPLIGIDDLKLLYVEFFELRTCWRDSGICDKL